MYNRGRRQSSAQVMVGPAPTAPDYRTWWEAELARSMEDMKTATQRSDVHLVKLMSKRVREAKAVLNNRAAV
jgi:hypothetical protein